ncbi:LysR family transcriptional regulator [Kocuria sp. cx-116]|uniref:LysR family transcriptional regulator n=1 Tax=Kocuria sp. cx-116 TaxID=2771378 RepID=UPI0016850B37|nr:LysR family transcriptional regulator [Kocuria sp. cx-116]MBD2762152.1 LysR family transcriptional regulator [Kocuria sp. cx-116]
MAVNVTRLATCFVAVSEYLHFGRAAEYLGMSQPALSQAIRQLESLLGCQLFIRSGSGVALSRDGETALMQARTLIRAEQDFLATRDRAVPLLGIAHEMPQGLALALIQRLQPVTAVRLSSAQCVADVRSGALAAGVVITPALLTGVKPLVGAAAQVMLWTTKHDGAITTAAQLRSAAGTELAVSPRRWNTAVSHEVQDSMRRAGATAALTEVENDVAAFNVIARGGCILNLGREVPGCRSRRIDAALLRIGFQLIVQPTIRDDAGWAEAFTVVFNHLDRS